MFVLGLLIIRTRHLLLTTLLPFYAVIAVVVLSAFANHSLGSSVDVVVKFGYLIVITIAVYESISERGEERTMSLLLWAMVTPVFFQFLSVIFGISKGVEGLGAGVSYVGGYNHEAGFSTVLATGFVIACFATSLSLWLRGGALLTLLAGLFLANYRTAIVAFAPMVLMQFNADVLARFSPRVRIIIGLVLLGITTAGAVGAAWVMRDKFADMSVVFSDPGNLIKPQAEYTPDEKRLLSARPYIWAGYIDAYVNGGLKNWVLGFGPNAWVGKFPVYAHNTLVGTLYEYGIVGVDRDDRAVVLDVHLRPAREAWAEGQAAGGACQLPAAEHGDHAALDHRGEPALRHHLRLYLLSAAGPGHQDRAAAGQRAQSRRWLSFPGQTS